MRTTLILPLAALVALALTGCTSHTPSNPVEQALGVAPRVPKDPVAGYHQYQVTSQLAEGLYDAGVAVGDIHGYFDIRGKLPTSAEMAESVESRDVDRLREALLAGKYVERAAIGPAPGVVTVTWGGGALAGKTLVLLPELGNRLCFRVDSASTTVPAATLAHANIVNECHAGE